MSDETALLVEPFAGGIHAALQSAPVLVGRDGPLVAVLGAGTMGLGAIAGLRRYVPDVTIVVGARYPHQVRFASEFGADEVVAPGELARAVRRRVGCHVVGDFLSGGADATIDAVGSSDSLTSCLRLTRPRGRVVLMGMPAEVTIDLTGPLAPRDRDRRRVHVRHRAASRRSDGDDVRAGDGDGRGGRRRTARVGRLPARRLPRRDRPRGSRRAARRRQDRLRSPQGKELTMPRPGFVLDVDRSTPPIMFWRGEGFSLEKLPADRSRVIYPPEPLPALDDIDGAIDHALRNPIDHDPLPSLMQPGMKLTIAFDDVSLPLPKMRRPDIRQRVIEAVLDMAADAGVDDVVLIAALALHRRMSESELRHAVGDRVYDAFEPRGLLTQHDAEDPDNLAFLGTTPEGEEVEINKRAAESDLLVYVNLNLVAMDGGWKSTATGLASYRSLRHHHNPETMEHSTSFMDQHRSELHKSNRRMGKVLVDSGVKIFQIETTLNTDTFPSSFEFLAKREWEWTARDRAAFVASSKSLGADSRSPGAPDLPLDRGAAPDDEHPGGRGRRRARRDDRARLRAADDGGARPDRTS
ncbi:MAG: lactate racemase domain-containing protein [Ilumatobacteraceae bacterium]